MASLRRITETRRHLGIGWLTYRAYHAIAVRLGLLERRMPARPWQAQPLADFIKDGTPADVEGYANYRRAEPARFLFRPRDRQAFRECLSQWDDDKADPIGLSDELAARRWPFYAHEPVEMGYPPDWHANTLQGGRAPADRHWSRISDFAHGDIKAIWEPSRFGFAYALVRAYWRDGDEKHVELFWQLVESWLADNPPQRGVNWKCGQEISFRVMAWCFGLYGFLTSPTTTAERVHRLAQAIAVFGRRIEGNLGYALSQNNNHGVSEGLGLFTIGLLFPEFKRARGWREKGRRVLERLARRLIYDDGSFSQHSSNYHRLMLHDYLWCMRLGELNGHGLSAELEERVGRAGRWLYRIQDASTGQVPNCGQNDGALILPLSNCDYRDFRPVVQATHYLATHTRCYPEGPWDEDLLWLFGPEALEAPQEEPPRDDLAAADGGHYALRSQDGFAFIRCSHFRHRPAQADQLHTDIWWRGSNVALDAGTFSYNAEHPWDNPLSHTAYHNTVTVDDQDQMTRVGKFLWLPWARGRSSAIRRSSEGRLVYWEGEHDGYGRLKPPVNHRRAVLGIGDGHWLIVDALSSRGEHRYRLHWLLADLPHEWEPEDGRLTLQTPEGSFCVRMGTTGGSGECSLVRADESSPRGWHAPYYSHREPALSVAMTIHADTLLFWTLFGPEPCDCELSADGLELWGQDWRGDVRFQPLESHGPLISGGTIEGAKFPLPPGEGTW